MAEDKKPQEEPSAPPAAPSSSSVTIQSGSVAAGGDMVGGDKVVSGGEAANPTEADVKAAIQAKVRAKLKVKGLEPSDASGDTVVAGDLVGGQSLTAASADVGQRLDRLAQQRIQDTLSRKEQEMSDEKAQPRSSSFTVNANNAQGPVSVSAGGDQVAGDKTTITNTSTVTTTTTTSVTFNAEAFSREMGKVQQQVDALPGKDEDEKKELKETVQKIEAEVKKGDQAKPDKVERWIKFIAGMSEDIAKVTVATITNPALGVVEAVRLIAQKAKEEKA